jgi:hypothetical protein
MKELHFTPNSMHAILYFLLATTGIGIITALSALVLGLPARLDRKNKKLRSLMI